MKCYKCKYYYVTMCGENGCGYNPFPFCHYYEDTNKSCDIINFTCFKKAWQI